MTELVLDASVLLKWFRSEGESHIAPARALRAAFERGALVVLVPPLLYLEIVNVAARRWDWSEDDVVALAGALEQLELEADQPKLEEVARWSGRGLTAYDASYVALAEQHGIPLVTADEHVLTMAPGVAISLVEAAGQLEAGVLPGIAAPLHQV